MPQYFDSTAAFPRKTKKRKGYYGGGRTNLLEELGRVEAEPSNRNRRAEISRVHGELNRGYAKGGRAGYFAGSLVKNIPKLLKKLGTCNEAPQHFLRLLLGNNTCSTLGKPLIPTHLSVLFQPSNLEHSSINP